MNEVTDGGEYTCHVKFDTTNEFDEHFSIHVNCELNKCHGYAKIVNDMPATTVVAPISSNQIITTTISTPHLMKVTTTTTITANNPMVKQNNSGVGKSSLKKRHILSNSTSTASVSTPSHSVLQSNQHMNLYDVEITTAPNDSITTIHSDLDDVIIRRYSARRQMPTPSYTMEKWKRRG